MADIYFSDINRTQIYRLPILPQEMPELETEANNEGFETFDNGIYNILGNKGLVQFTIESFIPGKGHDYPFAKAKYDNPYDLINLWHGSMIRKTPVRCIMYRDNKTEILNWLVSIESLKWHEDEVGDIKYSLTCKEYRQVTL